MTINDRVTEAKSPSERGQTSNLQSYVADLVMKAPHKAPLNRPEANTPHALVLTAANELYADHTLPAALSRPLSANGAAQDGNTSQTCLDSEVAKLDKELASLTNEVAALDKQLASLEKGTNGCHGCHSSHDSDGSHTNESGFTINDGQLRINGKPLSGVALKSEYAQKLGPQATADQIASSFPGINVVRLATSPEGGAFSGGKTLSAAQGAESINDINQLIKALNAKGIGVVVDNHGSDASTRDNVAQTGNEAAWFAQIAKDNLNNPMVMFQTENEPTSTDWRTGSNNAASDAAITNEQQAAYKAIRATGSKAIVAFEQEHGVPDEGAMFKANASTYNQDYNYVIDAHDYGNPAGDSDPAAQIKQVLSQTSMLREADGGTVPVYFGETGNAGNGSDIDPNTNKLLNGLWSSGDGAIAWFYNPSGGTSANDADDLTVPHTIALSPYGKEIQYLIEHANPEPITPEPPAPIAPVLPEATEAPPVPVSTVTAADGSPQPVKGGNFSVTAGGFVSPDADYAFLSPDGSQLTPDGQELTSWI